mmetsp:Transcript_1572/g.5769  ORF Transcript_1572/g.5769 Transcript_1572/m.5769 type:complete len:237 (+) Transcript_1572:1297-2007(+)
MTNSMMTMAARGLSLLPTTTTKTTTAAAAAATKRWWCWWCRLSLSASLLGSLHACPVAPAAAVASAAPAAVPGAERTRSCRAALPHHPPWPAQGARSPPISSRALRPLPPCSAPAPTPTTMPGAGAVVAEAAARPRLTATRREQPQPRPTPEGPALAAPKNQPLASGRSPTTPHKPTLPSRAWAAQEARAGGVAERAACKPRSAPAELAATRWWRLLLAAALRLGVERGAGQWLMW